MSTNTTVEQPANVVVVDEENVTVEVQTNAFEVVLADTGAQGVQGPTGPQGPAGASHATYVHTQNTPASSWSITHNLACYPSVAVVDSAGNLVFGEVNYISNNSLTVSFSGSFSGQAFLN
jgi:hypothetical protein